MIQPRAELPREGLCCLFCGSKLRDRNVHRKHKDWKDRPMHVICFKTYDRLKTNHEYFGHTMPELRYDANGKDLLDHDLLAPA